MVWRRKRISKTSGTEHYLQLRVYYRCRDRHHAASVTVNTAHVTSRGQVTHPINTVCISLAKLACRSGTVFFFSFSFSILLDSGRVEGVEVVSERVYRER